MTAEVAIINNFAVALAADSAVTISATGTENHQKVYNTSEKLFMLSKYHPVGLMVYGNASIMGYPWEVLIKLFRKHLGDTEFDHIFDYMNHFIDFVSGFITEDAQAEFLLSDLVDFFTGKIWPEIERAIEEFTRANEDQITEEQIKEVVEGVLISELESLTALEPLPDLPDNHGEIIKDKYQEQITKAIENAFGDLPLNNASQEILLNLAAALYTTPFFPNNYSGVVISGFGRAENFPALCSMMAHCVVGGYLKRIIDNNDQPQQNIAYIKPFAQKEVVATFIEGIAPDYKRIIEGYLSKYIEDLPEILLDHIPEIDAERKKELLDAVKEVTSDSAIKLREVLQQYGAQYYISPILSAVGVLPKNELAEMAEALVNLTSFKRRVSMEIETVGGPVDVAVISKGDGFVWIKRKHYFDPKLNSHFFSNYYER